MSQDRKPPIADVLSGREVRFVRPRVLEISERHHDRRLSFAPPGTIALLVASNRGLRELERLVEAVEREDLDELEAAHSALAHRFVDFVLDPAWDLDALYEVPTFVTFRYGAKTLRRGMFAHGNLPIAHSLALYDGATLDPEHFTVLEHRAAGGDEQVHAVVVVRKPRLTELERYLFERIPAEVSAEINLGEEYGFWTGVVVTQAVGNLVQRVVNRITDDIGAGDEARAVEAIITAPAAVVGGIVNAGVQAIEGVVNAGLDAIGLGQAAADVENAVGKAVDDVVNAVADAIGDALAWVAHNVFTVDNANQQQAAQGNDQQANQQDNQAQDDNADNQADQGAGDDQQGQDHAEGSSWQSWVDQVEAVAREAEEVGAAVAVRQLLQLRAQMIAGNRVSVPQQEGEAGGE